jgi:hypothetical protein
MTLLGGSMSARKYQNEAKRYADLAQQATTKTVQEQLLRLAARSRSIARELETFDETEEGAVQGDGRSSLGASRHLS